MSQHYDIAIIGNNAAARMAGFLLARQGVRVAILCDGSAPNGDWLLPGLHLERLLELLGGKSEHAPPPRLQVVGERYRVEINGSYPLATEIEREFPATAGRVHDLLAELAATGQRLEKHLLGGKGLPLYRRNPLQRFAPRKKEALAPRLSALTDPDARDFSAALFAGLSLAPPEHLGLAEAGLLWGALTRPFSVAPQALDLLLTRRFEACGGTLLRPKTGTSLRLIQGSGWTLEFSQGPPLSAHFVVLGRSDLYAAETRTTLGLGRELDSPPLLEMALSNASLPPLLAPWVIVSAPTPLRLTLSRGDREQTILRAAAGLGDASRDLQALQNSLQRLFPFVPHDRLALCAPPQPAPVPMHCFPAPCRKPNPAPRLFLADSRLLYPRLGFLGETLIAFSAARQLGRRITGKQDAAGI